MAGTLGSGVRCGIVAVATAAALLLGGCETGQDPGIDIDVDAPATTSNTLPDCPPAGPDETTPAAGCIGADGSVVRP